MISTGLSIKIPEISRAGFSVPISGPILDIPIKISALSGDIKLRIQSLIILNGISLRKFRVEDARNMLTVRGVGKVSIQGKENIASVLGLDARDAALDMGGIGFMKPAYNMLRFGVKKLGIGSNADETSQFIANLSQNNTKQGTSRFSIAKWNKYRPQGDESIFGISGSEIQGSCILRVNTLLDLTNIEGSRIVSRTNIPLFGLSRDHARSASIRALTRVSSSSHTHDEIFDSYLDLGPIRYRTIVSEE